jgi:hypothetical protein
MSDAVRELLVQYHALSPAERAEFEDQLPDSELDLLTELDEVQLDPDFMAMIEERLASAKEHPEKLRDGPTVMAEALQRLKSKSILPA